MTDDDPFQDARRCPVCERAHCACAGAETVSDTAPPFRVRCPADDGTRAHTSVDLGAPISLADLSRALKALKRCPCGQALVMLSDGAPEPSERPEEYAAERARGAGKRGRRGR